MKTSDTTKELSAALAKAQSSIRTAQKNKRNPHLKNEYADLASIWAACRAALTEQGLSVVQEVLSGESAFVSVATRIIHASGEWIEVGPLVVPVQKFDAQGVGSAISYGKRYALAAAVGVVSGDEDDDAEAAGTTGLAPAEQSMLDKLTAAANDGIDALQSAFEGIPKSPERAAVWKQHGETLKQIAASVQ